MTHQRPFRFGIQGRSTGPRDEWLAMVRRVEELGYGSYLALDHFVRGLDPVASLTAAAMATERLRIGSLVFDNDFRHPALLAKAAATLDVLSGGRLELGIGAGWLKEEYDQTGIPFDPAGLRIERMTEAVRLLKRIFTEEHPVSFAGEHYTVTDLICPPHPVQKPHPPIIIGGGSKRVLTVAGREADIVGITTRARAGRFQGHRRPHRRGDGAKDRLGPRGRRRPVRRDRAQPDRQRRGRHRRPGGRGRRGSPSGTASRPPRSSIRPRS